MWSRWAARRRLVGLGFLTGAAVAIAAAFLVWVVGGGWLIIFPILVTAALLVLAGYAFVDAAKYARLAAGR
jgi:uncharacterized membrane protein